MRVREKRYSPGVNCLFPVYFCGESGTFISLLSLSLGCPVCSVVHSEVLKRFYCSAKLLRVKPHHLYRPLSPKGNTESTGVFVCQKISFLQCWMRNIIRTFQNCLEAFELENGQSGLHSVRLMVICEPPKHPPLWLTMITSRLGCFSALMWSAASGSTSADTPAQCWTWTQAGTRDGLHSCPGLDALFSCPVQIRPDWVADCGGLSTCRCNNCKWNTSLSSQKVPTQLKYTSLLSHIHTQLQWVWGYVTLWWDYVLS